MDRLYICHLSCHQNVDGLTIHIYIMSVYFYILTRASSSVTKPSPSATTATGAPIGLEGEAKTEKPTKACYIYGRVGV